MITQEKVRELFEYRDGKLYWRINYSPSARKGYRAGVILTTKLYQQIQIRYQRYLEHQIIFLYFYGYIPKEIDHISDELTEEGIKDNHIENLQSINHSDNIQKSSKTWGKSKYKGVHFAKSKNKWRAVAIKNYKTYHLGYFYNEEEAAKAYDEFALEHYGKYGFHNFPEAILVPK